MCKALWLFLLLAAGALYAAPERTDVWAEFTWCGSESTPTETIHKYKLKLSPNFPADRVSLVLAVDVFGGGSCTPLRKLGNDFHLKYSVSPAKSRGGVLKQVVARIAFGREAGDIVADAALTFGGAPGHDRKIQYECRKPPKLELMARVVLYPGDVTPLCALTTRASESSPTTEFRFSPWKKPPRSGLYLRLVPEEVLEKADRDIPYHMALRREVLERLGISPDAAGGCNLDELDCCIAEYEACRLRFETGTATLAELLDAEFFVRRVVLRQRKLDPQEQKELRRKLLVCMQKRLELRKAEFAAGTLPIESVKVLEEQIAECRRTPLDRDSAVAMAERHFVRAFGEEVLKERPWRVTDDGDRFVIKGTPLRRGKRREEARIVLRKSDGLIRALILSDLNSHSEPTDEEYLKRKVPPAETPARVPLDRAAAVAMAERHFVEVYGERVLKQRPWRVIDTGDAFLVNGTLPPTRRGGTAKIWLRKSDGLILELIHYK